MLPCLSDRRVSIFVLGKPIYSPLQPWIMWREAARWCCGEHSLVHTMRSARDLPAVLGTVCRAPGEATLRTIWLAPQHDAALTHFVRNTDHCGCMPVTKNIHTHARTHAPGGLNRIVVLGLMCARWILHTSRNTLHRDAWAAAMLSELIQALKMFSFPPTLKTHTRKGRSKSHRNNRSQNTTPCREVSHFRMDPL